MRLVEHQPHFLYIMTSQKTKTGKQKEVIEVKKIFGILFFVAALFSAGCNNTTSGPTPLPQFWPMVEVIYDRSGAVVETQRNVILKYELYDPDNKTKSKSDREVLNSTRYGYIFMDPIGSNLYRAYLEQVYVQMYSAERKHVVCVEDDSVHPQYYTAIGVSIQGAIEAEILNNYQLHFKMSKQY
jgi:hypothetical protein